MFHRPERPKSAKVRKQQNVQTSDQTSTALSSSPPRSDGHSRVYQNLGHLEGEKTKSDNLNEEERLKENEEVLMFVQNGVQFLIPKSP